MKMNRKVVRSVICVLLALIFIVSLMTALIPINASAASQSEINQLTQQRKELQAKQKEQQKTAYKEHHKHGCKDGCRRVAFCISRFYSVSQLHR